MKLYLTIEKNLAKSKYYIPRHYVIILGFLQGLSMKSFKNNFLQYVNEIYCTCFYKEISSKRRTHYDFGPMQYRVFFQECLGRTFLSAKFKSKDLWYCVGMPEQTGQSEKRKIWFPRIQRATSGLFISENCLSRLAPSVTRVAICVSRVLLDGLQKKERLLVVYSTY